MLIGIKILRLKVRVFEWVSMSLKMPDDSGIFIRGSAMTDEAAGDSDKE